MRTEARRISIHAVMMVLGLGALAPSMVRAQSAPSCVDNTQCPQGTLCMSGACVQQQSAAQVYAQPQPYPGQQYQQYPQPAYAPQPGYAPQYPAPARQPHDVTRPNVGLIVSGAVMLGVGWITNIVAGMFAGLELYGSSSSGQWDSFRVSSIIPVAGPWVQLAVKPTSFSNDGWAEWLIIDGLLQLAGATLLVVGVALPQHETVYSDRGGDFQLAIVPRVGDQWGLAAVGRF